MTLRIPKFLALTHLTLAGRCYGHKLELDKLCCAQKAGKLPVLAHLTLGNLDLRGCLKQLLKSPWCRLESLGICNSNLWQEDVNFLFSKLSSPWLQSLNSLTLEKRTEKRLVLPPLTEQTLFAFQTLKLKLDSDHSKLRLHRKKLKNLELSANFRISSLILRVFPFWKHYASTQTMLDSKTWQKRVARADYPD